MSNAGVEIAPSEPTAETRARKRPHRTTRRTQSIAKHPKIHQVPSDDGWKPRATIRGLCPQHETRHDTGALRRRGRLSRIGGPAPVGRITTTVDGGIVSGWHARGQRPRVRCYRRDLGTAGGPTGPHPRDLSLPRHRTPGRFHHVFGVRQGPTLAVVNVAANVVMAVGGVWVGRSIAHLFT